jgi:hypothetical protein
VPTVTLTDLFIRSIKPIDKRVSYVDRSIPGLTLRVSPKGVRSFSLVHGARRQRTNLGRYPSISLQDARTAAKRILAERTLGRHLPRSTSFEDALTIFLAECEKKVLDGRMSDSARSIRRSGDHFRRAERLVISSHQFSTDHPSPDGFSFDVGSDSSPGMRWGS